LIAIKFGADIAGFLAMTLRVLSAPIGLIGSSVLDVFKRYAAEAYRNRGECVAEYKHTFNILFTASVITSCGLFFIVKPFFVFAYGESWKASGEIAIWLIPMFALRFIASPLSFMAYIAEKQHFDLLWQVCLLIFTVTSLIMTSTYDVALKIYSLSYAFLYLIYIGMSYKFSLGRINDRHN
jgi:O-antigen/teichoic acid export membrane protein